MLFRTGIIEGKQPELIWNLSDQMHIDVVIFSDKRITEDSHSKDCALFSFEKIEQNDERSKV